MTVFWLCQGPAANAGQNWKGKKESSLSFLPHNTTIDLMPINTNAPSLGKKANKSTDEALEPTKPLIVCFFKDPNY